VPPSRLNTLASQAAQTLISPASQVGRSQNRKTGVQLKRIIWGLPRSAKNPNPSTPGGERYRFNDHGTRRRFGVEYLCETGVNHIAIVCDSAWPYAPFRTGEALNE
jgi:hypothetical protein